MAERYCHVTDRLKLAFVPHLDAKIVSRSRDAERPGEMSIMSPEFSVGIDEIGHELGRTTMTDLLSTPMDVTEQSFPV